MVSFKHIATAIAALSVPAFGQSTPAQVVENINMLTQKSQALQAPAESVTIVNGPLIIVGQGPFPEIIRGFVDIVSTVTTQLAQMEGMAPVPAGADADAIDNAYRSFARVHQQLLTTLTGKAGLFNTVPFIGQPVAAVLRQDEAVLDSLSFALQDGVPSFSSQIRDTGNSLSMTVATAISAFEGFQTTKRDVAGEGRLARVMVA